MKAIYTKKTKTLMGIESVKAQYPITTQKQLDSHMWGFNLVSKDMLSLVNQMNRANPQTLDSFPENLDTTDYANAVDEFSKAAAILNRTVTDMIEFFNKAMEQLPE